MYYQRKATGRRAELGNDGHPAQRSYNGRGQDVDCAYAGFDGRHVSANGMRGYGLYKRRYYGTERAARAEQCLH